MSENDSLNKAIRNSMQTEKNAMDFYLIAAGEVKDPEVRKLFELLASEEREHAKSFYDIYKEEHKSTFDEIMASPPEKASTWIKGLDQMILEQDFNERHALELAMRKEKELETHLFQMLEKITDARARAVYQMNAESTHNHYEVIESEYARLMGMVHETDVDTYVRE